MWKGMHAICGKSLPFIHCEGTILITNGHLLCCLYSWTDDLLATATDQEDLQQDEASISATANAQQLQPLQQQENMAASSALQDINASLQRRLTAAEESLRIALQTHQVQRARWEVIDGNLPKQTCML